MATNLTRVLSLLVAFDGLAWGIGTLIPLYQALKRGSLPTVMGIRLLGGPFEALGLQALIAAGLVYVAISGLKLLAAYWLWNSRLDGAVLELILLGLSAIFWYGFALPFGPLAALPQIVLIVLVWRSLH